MNTPSTKTKRSRSGMDTVIGNDGYPGSAQAAQASAALRKKAVPSEEARAAKKTDGKRGGAPTLYRPEYCEQLIAFFAEVEDAAHIVLDPTPFGDKQRIMPNLKLPTLSGFAWRIGVSREVLTEWQAAHPEFLRTVRVCKAHQKHLLMNGGLVGAYDPTITKFLLTTVHGMTEKTEVAVSNIAADPVKLDEVYGTIMRESERRQAELTERRRKMFEQQDQARLA